MGCRTPDNGNDFRHRILLDEHLKLPVAARANQ
jgi:hypothetical protein